ncbi:MAG: hypothetical protein KDB82_02570 [Planctomycetes bacterium]|nr:hypothetical protein [Planctomycetota bacterium]
MRRLLYTLAILALLGTSACTSSGEIVYTGANEDAREGTYIKDPNAVGTTRDSVNRQDTTRTESNRVDIPVLEYAQLGCISGGYAMMRRSGYDTRYVRSGFAAIKYSDYVERRVGFEGYTNGATAEGYWTKLNSTVYPSLVSDDELSYRMGRDRYRAYSALESPWTDTGKVTTEAIESNSRVEAMRGEAYLEGARTRYGYDAAFVTRVVGLHLWKYADREIVTDAVEVTYTLVYYNTNEFDTGPTEIDEPVPYYTEYIENSATLPKDGTSVQYIKRPGNRSILRWKFPKGIKAGETNSMKYKVTVKLNAEPEYRPPEDQPGMPRENR